MSGSSKRKYKWLKCIKTGSTSCIIRETQTKAQTLQFLLITLAKVRKDQYQGALRVKVSSTAPHPGMSRKGHSLRVATC